METAVEDVRPVAPSRNHVLVLVAKVSGPTLRAWFLRPHTPRIRFVSWGEIELEC
jgi:hypothetical protein